MEAGGDNIVDIIRGNGRRGRKAKATDTDTVRERDGEGAKEIGAISSRLRR